MFSKVLVANRGEIACRILRTLDALGIPSVAIYSEADRNAPHVAIAREAFCIGPGPVRDSYLKVDAILQVAAEARVDAIHPGYGLLSENASFARAVEAAGITFIGPSPEQMLAFGLKHEARKLAESAHVPLVPGSPLLSDAAAAITTAESIGYPVMLKSTAGGGGIGMQVCRDPAALEDAFERVERLSQSHFGQGGVFLEKFIEHARHLEVQVFGDGRGTVWSLGIRDCSSQRRNQKVIEETPPPHLPAAVQNALEDAALRLATTVHYRSAGTVEFIYDNDTGAFYFLEVNTRLQVEHGVTELVTGIDLVEWMIRLAAGSFTPTTDNPRIPRCGHAIQARIYAENPAKDFQPSSGLLTRVRFPENVRCDHWIADGTEVSPHYDPLLAKIQIHSDSRPEAVRALQSALGATRIDGIATNLDWLRSVARSETFQSGRMVTRSLAHHTFQPQTCEILRGGTLTTVQDYPGRIGYWEVGVPPSGPMDSLAFRLGNRLLGNPADAAGIEITATGPQILFHCPTRAVLTGAPMHATLEGEPIPFGEPFPVPAGSTLDIGRTTGHGVRAYLCLAGGIDVPEYLGSRSTFTLGRFGGHGGRALRTGDLLPLGDSGPKPETPLPLAPCPDSGLWNATSHWTIAVLSGPHGAPDFFTGDDVAMFFQTDWKVHYNSARTGVRLIGPKPQWARTDGGEAGLHPSNIHDNAYAIGAIDFTGDMPVILGPDGPSLGGFVCPATIIQADLWKIGQLRPGDTIRFVATDPASAAEKLANLEAFLQSPQSASGIGDSSRPAGRTGTIPSPDDAVLHAEGVGPDRLVIRLSGDAAVLAEIGDMSLDFKLRFHIHVLYESIAAINDPAVIDLTPGIRSLQVHFDPLQTDARAVAERLADLNRQLPPLEDITLPSRIVHLPLSWDDPSTREATLRYMQSVRADAPWCPDNIEFIRRINGLETREDVYRIVFDARYVVLGLGDVYLGAPVATPLDPRHRLVTTKYNPARTWTPENAVGIGGAYLCIYGMEGPGGYQFVGRTIQMWNRFRSTRSFQPGKPWLLRFFDQIRFYPVTAGELLQLREDFPEGRFNPRIEETTFNLGDYLRFLRENDTSIRAFKSRQQSAFDAERQRWEAAGIAAVSESSESLEVPVDPPEIAEDEVAAESPVSGTVWKQVAPEVGSVVRNGEVLAILESMKMEIEIHAPIDGILTSTRCQTGQAVTPGQALFTLKPLDPEAAASLR